METTTVPHPSSDFWPNLRRFFVRLFRSAVLVALTIVGLALAVAFGPRTLTHFVYEDNVYWADNAPTADVAIVFGAGLRRDGRPSAVLRHRVETAAELYLAGNVRFLLFSGDNTTPYYNEPAAMRDYAMQLGVPESAIVLDYAGRRTYDTCLRANAIFGVSQALLVTQHYHLDRALFTCDMLGLTVQGVAADRGTYPALQFFWLRELPATTVAFWDVFINPPLDVVLGDPISTPWQEDFSAR